MDLYNVKKYCLRPDSLIPGNAVEMLETPEIFFEKIFRLVEKAEKSLLIEFYEIADDKIGEKFSALLAKKASEGVEILLIYDSAGSILTSGDFFRKMERAGVRILEFNPVRFYRPYWKWWRRDHRKMIVADYEAAVVGGFNISGDYAPFSMGGKNWKDCGAMVEGPAAAEIAGLFRETWITLGGERFAISPAGKAGGDTPLSVVSGSGVRNFLSIRRSYKYAIDNARDSIYITNAYFLPDRLIYRRLIQAVLRGVKVRIITPYKTDHPYVRLASWAMFGHMIKNGVEIYEWQKEILHSKTAVIDGYWVSVGSHNLDHRSLHYNLELNVNVFDEKIGREMERSFLRDLKNCRQITLKDCRERILSSKLLSRVLYFLRSWL